MSVQILYEAATGAVYGTVGGVFKAVADNWTALDDTGKVSLYQQTDEGNADLSSLITLGKFKAHVFIAGENIVGIARPTANGTGSWMQTVQDGAGIYTPKCIVTAAPQPQIVIPKAVLPLNGASSIMSVSLTANIDSMNSVTVAVTSDLKTYKTYNFGASAWETIDITSSAAMLKSGIPAAGLASIPTAAWAELGLNGFGVAYCLKQTVYGTACDINKLTLTATLSGRWDHAVYNSDYRYGYTSNTTMQVTFLEAGSFKINYTNADSSREITTAQEPMGIAAKEGSTDVFTYVDEQGDNLL